MKALVISGGGSKSAFAGGVAEFLIKECGKEYDMFIGSSAGSLLLPLLAIGETDKLKQIYTSVTQKDIFNACPFIIRKDGGAYETRINHWSNIWMFIKGKKTLGESKNLRKLIGRTFSEKEFDKIRNSGVDVIATVANLSSNEIEYKSVKDYSYIDFCDWMWASANVVPFMSMVVKDGFEYADGGMGEKIPINRAISKGATEIDVIVLGPRHSKSVKKPVSNSLELVYRVFDFMMSQIRDDDIVIGELQGVKKNVNLNFYYCPQILIENSLIFDPEPMREWWEFGFRFAKQNSPLCHSIKAAASN